MPGKTNHCHTCKATVEPKHIAKHIAMHRTKKEDCEISDPQGTTMAFDHTKTVKNKASGVKRPGLGGKS